MYFDGKKDAIQVIVEEPNRKIYRSTQLEEHYVWVDELGTYYLTHLSNQVQLTQLKYKINHTLNQFKYKMKGYPFIPMFSVGLLFGKRAFQDEAMPG